MYKKFKIVVILIICNFFFLTSCQNEDLTEETKQQELDIAIQRKNFNAFHELPELISKHLTGNSSETFSRNIDKDPLYDFDIDSTSVTQIIKNGKTFYTLAIYRENRENNSFENLVISKDGSNNEAYIIKYFPSPEYYQNLKTNIHTHFIGGIDVTTLDYNQLMGRGERSCYTVTIAYCGNGSAGTLAGPGCYKHSDGGAHVFTRSYSVCEESPDNLTYISPYISQTDSGGGGTVSPLNPIVTEPILVFSERHFVMGLSPEQKAWWDDSANNEAKQDILNYLQQNQTEESEQFVEELIDFSLNNQTYASNLFNNLNSENWSNESIQFTNYAIEVLEVNPNANPLIGADCRSFEFAQPPGVTKKGCAVTNFNHTFYTAGIFPSGSPYFGEIDSTVPIAYFTMPTWMTNGRAANLTAKAVTFAIKATDLYYAANPTVSEVVLGQYFSNRLSHFLNAVGGTVSTSTPPFSIPSPAPYITSLIGVSNPYNCE